MFRSYVNSNVFHHVVNQTNKYEMWKKLESMYERKNPLTSPR